MSAHLDNPQEVLNRISCHWCFRPPIPLPDNHSWQCTLTSLCGDRACTRVDWRQCDLNVRNGGKHKWEDNY